MFASRLKITSDLTVFFLLIAFAAVAVRIGLAVDEKKPIVGIMFEKYIF